MRSALDALFRPRSVVVIGASKNPSKIGHIALKNLLGGQFAVHAVNPGESQILGVSCYQSVLDIPGTVDLAVITLPAPSCVEPTRQCAQKGVGVVAVSSSGFRESGPEGQRLENELLSAIQGT